jgi:alpha-D-ribose 1-methylphosphonate 5-triphosphate synthase subunit PhnH
MGLRPGEDPARLSQAVFRAVMAATARPGSIHAMAQVDRPPQGLSGAAAAIALALVDHETPVFLDAKLASADAAAWLRLNTSAPIISDPSRAAFAFVADPMRLCAFEAFALGTPDNPDRSTTLVLQVERFEEAQSWQLSGPGVRGTRTFAATPLPADFANRMAANHARFPCGVDLILVAPEAVAALPRTVNVARNETG